MIVLNMLEDNKIIQHTVGNALQILQLGELNF
jgi:hypothetical protein